MLAQAPLLSQVTSASAAVGATSGRRCRCSQSAFRKALPSTRLQSRQRRCAVIPNAAEPTASGSPILEWKKDTETFQDLMGFAGSAPERANGRVAMISYALILSSELSSHTSILEQAPNAIFSIASLAIFLSIASIVPKFVSGTSLKDLHAAAKPEDVESAGAAGVFLRIIDSEIELWIGRIAMLGFAGTVAAEVALGKSIF